MKYAIREPKTEEDCTEDHFMKVVLYIFMDCIIFSVLLSLIFCLPLIMLCCSLVPLLLFFLHVLVLFCRLVVWTYLYCLVICLRCLSKSVFLDILKDLSLQNGGFGWHVFQLTGCNFPLTCSQDWSFLNQTLMSEVAFLYPTFTFIAT